LTKNRIKTVQVQEIQEECKGIKSLTFNVFDLFEHYETPIPGQFIMVWVPSVDEVPMSLSQADSNGNWTITVKNVGECTNALHNLSEGDYIGVRGPLGNGFTFPDDKTQNVFLVSGGIGTAPLRFLAQELRKQGFSFTFIEGVRQKSELLFDNDLQKECKDTSDLIFCTDNGSFGVEGFASTTFKAELNKCSEKELSNTIAYTCGPELMMYQVFKLCEEYQVPLQASLERVMRCGCGLCGLCALEPLGLLVCKDGPIFKSETLRQVDDFAKYKLDFSGKKVPLS
jgi:dihydroorotate dehydrogenase electron transfer subunit